MHQHIYFEWKPKKKMKKSKRAKTAEDFAEEQLERYIALHREHEKDLNYIG